MFIFFVVIRMRAAKSWKSGLCVRRLVCVTNHEDAVLSDYKKVGFWFKSDSVFVGEDRVN